MPLEVAGPADSFDMSRAMTKTSPDAFGFGDPYYMRSAFDGMPESLIFSVPKKYYR